MTTAPTEAQKQIIEQKIHQVLVNSAQAYQDFRSSSQEFKGLDAAMHVKYGISKEKAIQYDSFRNDANPGEAETDRDKYYSAKQNNDARHMTLLYKAGAQLGISREQIDSAEGAAPSDPTAPSNILNEVIARAERNAPLPSDAHLAAAPRPPQTKGKGR